MSTQGQSRPVEHSPLGSRLFSLYYASSLSGDILHPQFVWYQSALTTACIQMRTFYSLDYAYFFQFLLLFDRNNALKLWKAQTMTSASSLRALVYCPFNCRPFSFAEYWQAPAKRDFFLQQIFLACCVLKPSGNGHVRERMRGPDATSFLFQTLSFYTSNSWMRGFFFLANRLLT